MKDKVNKEYTAAWKAWDGVGEPPLYQVLIENDDYTPMEFVVTMLERFFHLGRQAAAEIMLKAHVEGKAVCGIYTRDVAETKISQMTERARSDNHPLVLTMEDV